MITDTQSVEQKKNILIPLSSTFKKMQLTLHSKIYIFSTVLNNSNRLNTYQPTSVLLNQLKYIKPKTVPIINKFGSEEFIVRIRSRDPANFPPK